VVEGELSEVDRRSSRLGAERFALHMAFLAEHYRVISLHELMQRLASGDSDPRCLSITFDDAYAGVAEVADPILERLGLPAAVFAITSTLDHPQALLHYEELEAALQLSERTEVAAPELGFDRLRIASDKSRALFLKRVKTALKGLPEEPRDEIQRLLLQRLGVTKEQLSAALLPRARKLTTPQLRALAASGRWTVGAHTRSHKVLSRLHEQHCRDEVAGSHRDLLAAMGEPPSFLAYPYGKPEHVGGLAPRLAAEAGFRAAFTTTAGPNLPGDDPFHLKRVELIDLLAAAPPAIQQKARQALTP
jgi:peptidoglycan/xylan/chitin deacetylase (PgdA/CDA1 family)